ncbi:SDR family NAD(P)-dependent oxidoreductase [Saccharopolyspora sp. WRP15-2]|uniref:SDR family NAD(P)-dependent oxidoreductase n=1 Tax=Saccharopolyspora oryzae TaxID=2997343 RepID=A0ABT4UUZ0_9PSEU|nr:SDR family oxidoreductase [Saccharopolyspora oryzae]MDA3625542.1 SDR family NAD(P)-dependent oxidoreductase [Saccharopolyspora oryzae]
MLNTAQPTISLGFTPGDVLLVSGAGSGIGEAIALRAAELGLAVAAWDLDGSAVAATVDRITRTGGKAIAVTADVSAPADVERGFAESRRLGEIRYLVNNAGPSSAGDLDFDDGVRIAVGSVRSMTETWLSAGVPEGAALVNIASVAGNLMGTDSPWYCAAKAGIAGYTRHLATYRNTEVRSNAVAPGMTDTPRLRGFARSEVGQRSLEKNPMKRMATADDIAWSALFLLCPLASYINGVLLPVDGGWAVTQ